jgi:hypothetical protein
LHVILTQVPRLLAAGIRQRRIDLLVAAFDTAIPPLSLLAVFGSAALAAGLVVGLCSGQWAPAGVIGVAGIVALGAVLATWRHFAPREARWTSLLAAPHYMARKIPLYLSFMVRRQKAWVRTARESPVGLGGSGLNARYKRTASREPAVE